MLTDNLVSYWKLDETTGNASDSSGNNHTMTNVNCTYWTWKINNAWIFNGTSATMTSISSAFGISGTNTFSVAWWLYVSALPASKFYIYSAFVDSTNYNTYDKSIRIYPDWSIKFEAYDGTSKYAASSAWAISAGQRYHVVAVFNWTQIKLYLNWTLLAITPCASTYAESSPMFGLWHMDNIWNTTLWYYWYADELWVRNRVLSDGWVSVWNLATWEIAQLYNWWNGLSRPFTTGSITNTSFLLLMV